jgi:DMSO/TMAO reductase YedYZ molybdopterin-dependent catalytic subunit
MNDPKQFLAEHIRLTRRFFLGMGTTSIAFAGDPSRAENAEPTAPEMDKALAKLEPYFTTQANFQDVSRGKPLPHKLPDHKKREVGLTRETWKLEVLSDPDHPATLGKQFTKEAGAALDFKDLLQLADKHAVRFPKVMTCLNIGCPLGMGIWEGVPLREVIWLTRPRENLRRVYYHGYHNDDPKQIFRSSLPIDRALEDPYDWPPVILCYKLNGQWLDSQRGGPVRIVVPEGYGFKSVKWLTHIVLTNLYHANDTYAQGNNDVASALKTFAATLSVPGRVNAGEPIPITGYAQVGISGLAKVQVWIHPRNSAWPADDPHFTKAVWTDARILPPPRHWAGDLPESKIPERTAGFDPATGRPLAWPLRLCKVHWASLLPGLPAGEYTLRCRTIDEKGQPQPLPRPFRKSGHCALEAVKISVKT